MTYRILLVDDEAMSKRSLYKILTGANGSYRIVGEASDGAEALQIARREQPHLIITDISMPVMDGIELIQRLREDGLDMDIIILSGYGEFEYAQEALRHGVVDYILKPMKQEQVTLLVEKRFEHFKKSRQTAIIKNQLIAPISSAAERIGHELWIANEPGMRKELRGLSGLLDDTEFMQEERVPLLRDAASLISNRLQPQFPHQAWELPYEGQSYGQALASFEAWLDRLLNEIRDKRNWGKRGVIQQAIDYIKANFADSELNLEKVLAPLGISSTHFYHMLMEETGMSYIAFLTQIRMEHAKELLEHSDLKTYEVGQRCGYPDYPHFTKRFKRQVGLSPSEYRKNMQQA
ncbi:response regulator [Paenibacillus sp. PL91]|uniref:response regulator n=1 Tax=Paenibacillus sp. PL91 TaxID=2729538 RepID=UPI00145D1E9D|nr:response regulator [Paenibacillus sp. PL91]MBC9200118.1 response regulator [Paenibacillus sp. PL91]